MWKYIKNNNLQDPANKKVILLDGSMKSVFGNIDSFTMFEMPKHINSHCVKTTAVLTIPTTAVAVGVHASAVTVPVAVSVGTVDAVKKNGEKKREPNWNKTTSQSHCRDCKRKHVEPFFMCSSCENIVCFNGCDALICEKYEEGCWHGSCQDCFELKDRSIEYCGSCDMMLCEGCDPCRN